MIKTRIVICAVVFYLITLPAFSFNLLPNDSTFETQHFVAIDLIISTADVEIGGTLLLPDNVQTNELVIMCSGSGPQDRDETLEGFKIFKTIAEHLAKNRIASFRYDDRGVGASTGDFVNSRLVDHTADLENILQYFIDHKDHKFNDFVLLGHSQGGIVTSNVAVRNASVKKLILMGAPAVPLVDVVLYQVREEFEGQNIAPSLVEKHVYAHNQFMWAIETEERVEEAGQNFQTTLEAILVAKESNASFDLPTIKQSAKAQTKDYTIVYALPSLTSFLYHDPAEDYEKLEIPVLGLFGGLDKMVTIEQNKDRMERALLRSSANFQAITFDKANHFFQTANTGNREEYGTLEKAFVEHFLEEISNWLLEN